MNKPKVITLCGSSKWPGLHLQAIMEYTLAGAICIPMGCYGHADFPEGAKKATADGDEATPVKHWLDVLHFRKIDLSDEILVIRVGGYIGPSTQKEIDYATQQGKVVKYADFTLREAQWLNTGIGITDPELIVNTQPKA